MLKCETIDGYWWILTTLMNIDDYSHKQQTDQTTSRQIFGAWAGQSAQTCLCEALVFLFEQLSWQWFRLQTVASHHITPLNSPSQKNEDGSKFASSPKSTQVFFLGWDRRRPVAFARACTVAVFPKPGGPALRHAATCCGAPRHRGHVRLERLPAVLLWVVAVLAPSGLGRWWLKDA